MTMTSQLPITPTQTAAVPPARQARRVVVALPDSLFGAQAQRLLWQHGLEVHRAADGAAVSRLAWRLKPAVVVLPAESVGESGWLTCAKLMWSQPGTRVVLVGRHVNDRDERFRRFVGAAAILDEAAGPEALAQVILHL
jgi:DNA-binding response OmpR family regulator